MPQDRSLQACRKSAMILIAPEFSYANIQALKGFRTRAVRNRSLRANQMKTYSTRRSQAGTRSGQIHWHLMFGIPGLHASKVDMDDT